jgi:hypothetical protein
LLQILLDSPQGRFEKRVGGEERRERTPTQKGNFNNAKTLYFAGFFGWKQNKHNVKGKKYEIL